MKKFGAVAVIIALTLVAVAACVPYGPTVVAKVPLLDQTSAVSYTTFYTPASTGDYLVSLYAICSDSSTSTTVAVAYTDEILTASIAASTAGGGPARDTEAIHAIGGQPIQYQTYFSSSDSGYCDSYITLVAQ